MRAGCAAALQPPGTRLIGCISRLHAAWKQAVCAAGAAASARAAAQRAEVGRGGFWAL